jgi:16S rRNA (guanine966-N2)-methyltransferase
LRIISGKLKGIRFTPPKSFKSRPTTDFAKEALFNILQNEYEMEGLRILDLCSGTGSISFEFASRGAVEVTSVDLNGATLGFISKTAAQHGLDQIKTVKQDVLKFIQHVEGKYDLIFTDPPFDYEGYGEIIATVFERKLIQPEGTLIVEHAKKLDFSFVKEFVYQRNYGGVNFSFFEYEEDKN